jgi:putative flippase GtrA
MEKPVSVLRCWPVVDVSSNKTADSSLQQLLRYSLVGIAINLAGYLVYLLITFFGLPPKITMTFLYFIGATAGFWGNRQLTFMHHGSLLGSGVRYIVAHIFGYLINLTILVMFVDRLGFAHQWVQAVAIFVVAAYLFVAFKFFVFAESSSPAGNET